METMTNENVLISWRTDTQQAIPEGWGWGRKGVYRTAFQKAALMSPMTSRPPVNTLPPRTLGAATLSRPQAKWMVQLRVP